MKNMTAELNQNGIHYTLYGDYYLPDLELPEKASAPLGRYGIMRKAYLEEHRPGLYERLLLSGKLYEHLAEIDEIIPVAVRKMLANGWSDCFEVVG